MAHASVTMVDLSDDEDGDIDIGGGLRPVDPRVALELEDERDMLDIRRAKIQEEIQVLLEEQEELQKRREEIEKRLMAVHVTPKSVSKSGKNVLKTDGAAKWQASFEWDDTVESLRKNLFGIGSFRKHQREIINAVLSRRDVFVIMPAGGGKSLCYQLPAIVMEGVSLVISPLLSLIQDQVMGLKNLGIAATTLTSNTDKEEEKNIYKALEKGEGELRLLYVTPEKVARSKRFMSKLEKCNQAGRLTLIAIDEAHCCSQWGHDFRTDYASLSVLKKQFSKVPMIALTATATERVQTDVREMLQLRRCETFISSVNRPNLYYEVREKKSQAAAVIDDIASLIRNSYSPKDSGIVYCFSRRECEQVASELSVRGIKASFYHADMDPFERTNVHMSWSKGKLQVIVGTVAFGMGINKPDVRFVIHHSLSKSIETYYQESGRAGRDGLPSRCVIFFRCADVPRQSCMVFAENAGLLNLYAMARFCLAKQECLRAAIFHHFGENPLDCNGMCSNCAEKKNVTRRDVTDEAKGVVQLVKERAQTDQRATLLQLTDLCKKGVFRTLSRDQVEQLIVHLTLSSVLKEEFFHTAYSTNSYVTAGPFASRVLNGTQKVLIELEEITSNRYKQSEETTLGSKGTTLNPLQSPMERMLDDLREQLALKHGGIFPHSVLSSQHITSLCKDKPSTLEQVGEIVGEKRVEKYGREILEAIKLYLKDSPVEEDKQGSWVNPKGAVLPQKSSRKRSISERGKGGGGGGGEGQILEGNRKKTRAKGRSRVVESEEDVRVEKENEEESEGGIGEDDSDFELGKLPNKKSK